MPGVAKTTPRYKGMGDRLSRKPVFAPVNATRLGERGWQPSVRLSAAAGNSSQPGRYFVPNCDGLCGKAGAWLRP